MSGVLSTETMPARDDQGWVVHPDLDNLVVDGEEGADLPIDDAKLAAAGLQAAYVSMESQVEEGEPAFEEYWMNDGGVSGWQPRPPEGADWRVVAIYDTENGPYAMFVRPLST